MATPCGSKCLLSSLWVGHHHETAAFTIHAVIIISLLLNTIGEKIITYRFFGGGGELFLVIITGNFTA